MQTLEIGHVLVFEFRNRTCTVLVILPVTFNTLTCFPNCLLKRSVKAIPSSFIAFLLFRRAIFSSSSPRFGILLVVEATRMPILFVTLTFLFLKVTIFTTLRTYSLSRRPLLLVGWHFKRLRISYNSSIQHVRRDAFLFS